MEDKIICGCYKVTKGQIIDAIKNGADTLEKVGEITKAGTGCGACKGSIQSIIDEVKDSEIVCGCYKVTKGQIIDAIKNGADTLEKVGEITKAGTGCGACKNSIQSIIDEVKDSEIVCGCYKVTKGQIIDAIKNGADTLEKVGEITKAGTGCGACKGSIQSIIDEVKDSEIVCGCYKVTKAQIIDAVNNGADTLEKVGEITKAGTGCGACKNSIQSIIDEVKDSEIVCGCYKVTKGQIIDAVKNGADTLEKVGEITKAGTGCGACKGSIQSIIDEVKDSEIVCGCYKVTKGQIIDAIKNGADTVEKVGEITKAGTGCGACKGSIQSIIDDINGKSPKNEKGFFKRLFSK